jgi:hypothetical protein
MQADPASPGTIAPGHGALFSRRVFGVLLFDPLFPALSLGCFITVITFNVFRCVEAQRGEIRLAFGRYLVPAVVEQIIADPDRLVLGGEIRELTQMFCDVRDFTAISERLSATELTHFVNELLDPAQRHHPGEPPPLRRTAPRLGSHVSSSFRQARPIVLRATPVRHRADPAETRRPRLRGRNQSAPPLIQQGAHRHKARPN